MNTSTLAIPACLSIAARARASGSEMEMVQDSLTRLRDVRRTRRFGVAAALVSGPALVAVLKVFPSDFGGVACTAWFGLLFAVVMSRLQRNAAPRVPRLAAYVFALGLTFGLWGFVLASVLVFFGGPAGIPQAIITAYALRRWTGFESVFQASILGLVFAWVPVLAILWVASCLLPGAAMMDLLPIWGVPIAMAAWNAIMFATLGRCIEKELRWLDLGSTICVECEYPVHSIRGRRCPECGTEFSRRAR